MEKQPRNPPAAWRHLMLACLHDVSIKDSVMFYVSMKEQSTWTSWVHTNHWYPKHQKKLQKNQKTYRNLCKLPISANDNYISRTRHESFSEKKTPWGRFFGLTKNNNGKKVGRQKTLPFARGAANRRGWRRCCQGFLARGWRAQRRQTGAAGRTDQQPRGVHGGGRPKLPGSTGGLVDKRTKPPGFIGNGLEPKGMAKNLSEYWSQGMTKWILTSSLLSTATCWTVFFNR